MVSFVLTWPGSDLDLVLRSPNGTAIDSDINVSSIYYSKNETQAFYMIQNPDQGTWTMEVRPINVSTNGESYALFFYAPEEEDIGSNNISYEKETKFNGLYSSQGIDDDHNGLYDHIDVKMGVNVMSPGLYWASGSLYDENGEKVQSSNETYLNIGAQWIILKFYGMKHPGRFNLQNVTLFKNIDGNSSTEKAFLDYRENAYTTKKYQNIDPNPQMAFLTRQYTDHRINSDSDEISEFLTLDVGFYAIFPGNYTLQGYLYDLNRSEIAWSIDNGIFDAGYHIMHLNFDGDAIKKHQLNGPYNLTRLILAGRNWTTMDAVMDAYTTQRYNYTDFGV